MWVPERVKYKLALVDFHSWVCLNWIYGYMYRFTQNLAQFSVQVDLGAGGGWQGANSPSEKTKLSDPCRKYIIF